MDVCENMCQIYTQHLRAIKFGLIGMFLSVDAALHKVGRAAADGEFIFHQLKNSSVRE